MSKIKSINKLKISDNNRLYNLAVSEDESFVANEMVVHNCKSYIRANLKTSTNNPAITGLPPLSEAAQKSITFKDVK